MGGVGYTRIFLYSIVSFLGIHDCYETYTMRSIYLFYEWLLRYGQVTGWTICQLPVPLINIIRSFSHRLHIKIDKPLSYFGSLRGGNAIV